METIRLADENDAEGMLAIYGPYIKNTSYTFELEVPSIHSFAERINKYMINWPWLVFETGNMIAGYAYAAGYRERTAYQWSVETSVYVHDDFHRRGIAIKLYTALLQILRLQGFRNVYAVINLPNDKSVRFHESCGFTYFATYENVGYKLGQWKNVGWWRLTINDYTNDPLVPVKFSELNKDILISIFDKAETL